MGTLRSVITNWSHLHFYNIQTETGKQCHHWVSISLPAWIISHAQVYTSSIPAMKYKLQPKCQITEKNTTVIQRNISLFINQWGCLLLEKSIPNSHYLLCGWIMDGGRQLGPLHFLKHTPLIILQISVCTWQTESLGSRNKWSLTH